MKCLNHLLVLLIPVVLSGCREEVSYTRYHYSLGDGNPLKCAHCSAFLEEEILRSWSQVEYVKADSDSDQLWLVIADGQSLPSLEAVADMAEQPIDQIELLSQTPWKRSSR